MSTRRTILFLLGACCALAAASAQGPEGAERLQLANGLFARRMTALAAQEYEAILREEPDLAEADAVHFRLGECYRQMGKILEAEKAFRRVFITYPDSVFRFRAGFRRAGLFLDQGHYDGAVDLYRLLLTEDPPADIASASLYLLGEALMKLDREEEAVESFLQVEDKYPESEFHPYALLKLGQIYVRDPDDPERTERARVLFSAVAAKAPGPRLTAEARFQLAEWYYRAGKFSKSADTYAALARLHPDDHRTAESRLRAAWAMHNAGLYADAIARAAAVIGADSDPPDALDEWLYLRANCERQLMRHGDAVATYRMLIEAYPKSRFTAGAHYEMALALYKDGRYEDAAREARGLLNDPDLAKDVQWLLGESYAALGRTDEAIQHYRLLVDRYPDSPAACDALYRLGYHLQTREDYLQAADYFGRAARQCPDADLAPRALFASGYCLARAGQDEKAVRDWTDLAQRHGDSPLVEEAFFQRAMSEIRLTRQDDALRSLRELLQRFPESGFGADARFWEGRLLQQAGRYEDAEASLRRVLESQAGPDLKREAELALARVLHKQEKFDESADRFQAILETPSRDALSESLLKWLAEYRLERGEHARSRAAAERLVDDGRADTWRQAGWLLIGRCEEALGNSAAAMQAFEQVLETGGTTLPAADAALALGRLALAAGEGQRALGYFKRAAAQGEDADRPDIRARAYLGLARAARATGDLEGAARYFMSVAILYDDPVLVPECLKGAAQAFTALGNTNAAASALAELQQRYPEESTP